MLQLEALSQAYSRIHELPATFHREAKYTSWRGRGGAHVSKRRARRHLLPHIDPRRSDVAVSGFEIPHVLQAHQVAAAGCARCLSHNPRQCSQHLRSWSTQDVNSVPEPPVVHDKIPVPPVFAHRPAFRGHYHGLGLSGRHRFCCHRRGRYGRCSFIVSSRTIRCRGARVCQHPRRKAQGKADRHYCGKRSLAHEITSGSISSPRRSAVF